MSKENHGSLLRWLGQFLGKRLIKIPDGRSLYQYQCTPEEYRELLILLRSESYLSSKAQAACFSLFCAEWYRREYQSGIGWSWDGIRETLNLVLSPQDISHLIEKGLVDYWGRDLHHYNDGRRNFLGSVFAEGGLPVKALQEEGNKFKNFIESLLRIKDSAQLQGWSLRMLAEEQSERFNLPQVFTESVTIELIVNMVEQLSSLVKHYNLEDEANPGETLNLKYPGWRQSFPLPLESEIAISLLNSLLQTASEEQRAGIRNKEELSCAHYLEENGVLKSHLFLPSTLSFTLNELPNSHVFKLYVYESGEPIAEFAPAFPTFRDLKATLKVRQKEVIFKRKNPTVPLYLIATSAGVEVGSIKISESVLDVSMSPVGFESIDERWVYCGQGTFSTKTQAVTLLLPEGAQTSIGETTTLTTRKLQSAIEGVDVIRLEGAGAVFVTTAEELGDTYKIILSGSAKRSAGVELAGDSLNWPTLPTTTYVGLPKVELSYADGARVQDEFSFYINGTALSETKTIDCLGRRSIAVKNREGMTLLRRRVGVLPSDFEIELHAQESIQRGAISIKTKSNCFFEINNENVSFKKIDIDGGYQIALQVEGTPPTILNFRVYPSLSSDPITIFLPYPGVGHLLIDDDEQVITRKNLCVDQLLGVRAVLFGRHNRNTAFKIEMTLSGTRARRAYYAWQYRVGNKPIELSLYSLREEILNLLSLDDGIDAYVNLEISSPEFVQRYQIHRYSSFIEFNEHSRQISIKTTDEDSPSPEIALLHDPLRTPIKLVQHLSEGVGTGLYSLPTLIEKDGPWLVVPSKESASFFRPYFIKGNGQLFGDVEAHSIKTLQKAVQLFNHEDESNPIELVLEQMAESPNHSGWQFLKALFENYKHLPLAIFETWRALLRHPKALCMSFFVFNMDLEFLDKVEAEIPLLWEMYPIKELKECYNKYLEYLVGNGELKEHIENRLLDWFENFEAVFPSFNGALKNYISKDEPLQKFSSNLVEHLIGSWMQDLVRTRAESTWPELSTGLLKSWCRENVKEINVDELLYGAAYQSDVKVFPIFAAYVSTGLAEISDVFTDTKDELFLMHRMREFHPDWFNSMFSLVLSNNL